MIPEAFIRELRERADIVEVIDRRVPLKRSGKDYWALCPFDGEGGKPSFSVNRDKGFFHCFGCLAHGDALDFLQRHGGMSFRQALEQLAAESGMALPDQPARPAARPVLRPTVRFRPMPAAKDGHQPLGDEEMANLARWQQSLPGSPGEAYLASRRIPLDVAQVAGVGFLPAGEALGLTAEGKPTGYGPRVVFPHALPDGQIVNLYGRSTDPQADKDRRHRHLPRPKGLFNAQALDLPGPLWIVEGAFDALALMAAGVPKVIAIFGLAGFDWRWIGKQEILVALDCDESGDAAAQEMLHVAAYRGLKARRIDAQAFGGHKDAASAWEASTLDLTAYSVVPLNRETVAPDIRRLLAVLPDTDQPHLVEGWTRFRSFAARFASEYIEQALAAGWTLADLFSLPSSRLPTDAGLVWVVADFNPECLRIYPDRVEIETGSQHVLVQRRSGIKPSGVLPWA
jgi:hypothetical protein